MIKHGVGECRREFCPGWKLGRSNITQEKTNGNQGGIIGNARPREKFMLISRFSEEEELVARGLGGSNVKIQRSPHQQDNRRRSHRFRNANMPFLALPHA